MRCVGVYEAKAHLSKLIEAVEDGESITITKHGVPVATLSPAGDERKPSPQDAVEAMLDFQRRNHITTGGMSIKQMIEEGRP